MMCISLQVKKKRKKRQKRRLYNPKKKMQRILHLQSYWLRHRIHIRRSLKIGMWMNTIDDIHLSTLRSLITRTWMMRTVLISKSYRITIRR